MVEDMDHTNSTLCVGQLAPYSCSACLL